MAYLLEYREWRRLYEQAVALVPYKTNAIALGPNVSDGLLLLSIASGVEVNRILVDGVELKSPIDAALAAKITRLNWNPELREWSIFVAKGATIKLEIYYNSNPQPLSLEVNVQQPKQVEAYYVQAGSTTQLSQKLLPVPAEISYPVEHESLLKGTGQDACFLVIVKCARPFAKVDCSTDNLVPGKNWFTQDGLDFFYVSAPATNLEFDFDPGRVQVPFGQLVDPDSYPAVTAGSIRYVEIS